MAVLATATVVDAAIASPMSIAVLTIVSATGASSALATAIRIVIDEELPAQVTSEPRHRGWYLLPEPEFQCHSIACNPSNITLVRV